MWTLTAFSALALTPQEVPDPRPSGGWVADQAQLFDEGTERELNRRIAALHTDLGVEVAVVAVTDVPVTPKQFATDLFNLWGIGDARANNGLLVLMVTDARRLEMETGYGLEPLLTDGWLGTMQQQRMVPEFKAGRFGEGIVAGLEACDERLREHPAEARLGVLASQVPTEPWPEEPVLRAGSPIDPLVAGEVSFGGALGLLGAGLALGWRRRQRICPDCHVYMPKLDEEADDAHLTPGQRKEEDLGSVDHQVHACPTCDRVVLFRSRRRWFSGYSGCPRCDNQTCRTERKVELEPTRSREGRGRATTTCAFCQHQETHSYSIARLPEPTTHSSGSSRSWSSSSSSRSSSSSSSRGSWGGGRSGGGGAGSSW